jgi:predicted HicB family RNase H-like nuclease
MWCYRAGMAIALNVRLPDDLHAQLTARAKEQGVSLNTLIVAFLAFALGANYKVTR